ncbi:MAG TPA: FtsX-like permease family protein, partial [Longimicrobiaceae bacterium]|nr:FtsX-like permease family protein [Longimicrobiaceae bacterium]
SGARVVIVDQGFVDRMLQGRNPIGRRVRLSPPGTWDPDPARPWYEIVGVVKDLGMGSATERERLAGVYLPAVPGNGGPVEMVVHAGTNPVPLGPRIRGLAAAVDATLQITVIQRVDEITDVILWIIGLWLKITLVLTAIALLLSLAGIYAVLSFTVARRTREIGVRVALGASRGRVLAEVFRRPLTQVTLGVAAGIALVAFGTLVLTGHQPDTAFRLHWEAITLEQMALVAAHGAVMLVVCLLACVVPTQRALGVQPTEALRAE